ncbi:hypothetical protein Slin14017_G130160 [Septoria linicola]|nr:hypothetical protein Slin14017_G130160 [Septoria linicola]
MEERGCMDMEKESEIAVDGKEHDKNGQESGETEKVGEEEEKNEED